ncbi:MAG: DNA primase [Chloroflexi bacterium]|nr:DNA primase [Chloroflexota bacterium]
MPVGGVVDEIKDRLSIVDVISPYVALKKAGRNFKGLCPFHGEKTPSFVVYPDKGNYHCFGCDSNGDLFTFIMKTQNLAFGDALKLLADKAGVALPERRADVVEDRRRERLREINAAAAQFFHHVLMRSEAAEVARSYLAKRGINGDTVEAFQLGYAPDSWQSLGQYLSGKAFESKELLDAGLVVQKEGGDHYDRFRGRLMFPIRDIRGNVTGFGARALDSSQPKYLNSPQTPIFDKSSSLYGIDRAARAMREADSAVIVEGYVDVLHSHQCGMTKVVASLGTALTERQVATLKKLTKHLILALDPDKAGDEATLRGLDVAREVFDKRVVPVPTWRGLIHYEYKLDADIRIITLPRGKDPDEVIREDPARWQWLLDRALPIVDYYFSTVTSALDLTSAKDKSSAVDQLLPVIKELPDKVEQAHYLQKLAHLVQVNERTLAESLARVRLKGPALPSLSTRNREGPGTPHPGEGGAQASGGAVSKQEGARQRPPLSLEAYYLSLVLSNPELADTVYQIELNEVQDSRVCLVFSALRDAVGSAEPFDLDRFAETLDPALQDFVGDLLDRARQGPSVVDAELQRQAEKCLRELRRRNLRERIRQLEYLSHQAANESDLEGSRQFIEQIEQLRSELEPFEHGDTRASVWR